MICKSCTAIITASVVLLLGLTAFGISPTDGHEMKPSRAYLHSYNLPSSGLALDGYCPVAYHAVNKPVRGQAEYQSTYNDVTYYFVNADAKKEFDRNPEKYLPAYGGWCAFGMSIEDKFPVDPTNFKIIDGRLHVFLRNRNVDARELWNQGAEADLLKKAAAHWKQVSQ